MTRFLNASELDTLGLRALGADVLIDRAAILVNPAAISLGDHCRIDAFALILAGQEGVQVGKHVHIATGCQIFGGGGAVDLEDFTCLSGRVSVYTATDDFTQGFLTNPTVSTAYRNVRTGGVTLRKHSLVGCGSVVLPGVEMGFGSAAGALTVLRKSVAECSVVCGNPARQLSKRRDRARLERLEKEFLREIQTNG